MVSKKSTKKKSEKKESTEKKSDSKKKIFENRKYIILGVVIVFLIVFLILLTGRDKFENTSEEMSTRMDVGTPKMFPLEISQNKEAYEGKTIIILEAYVPSEAFIYIKETKDKIYLKPSNKNYCRNYDLKGVLKYNYLTSNWELEVEDYDNCLDEIPNNKP